MTSTPSVFSRPDLPGWFGIRSRVQVARDLARMAGGALRGRGFDVGVSSAGLVRPDLAWPAYLGRVPVDGSAPIYNLFDVVNGGRRYANRVTRRSARDHRGGRLTYDDHDGTDLVVPPGTGVTAAAPGVLVGVRDRWLRGGLTALVDHGEGVITQYSHLAWVTARPGQRLARGEPLARSGVSGVDLLGFFPWVPPHVHFMLWVRGRPVDPFAPLPDGGNAWLHGEPRIGAVEGEGGPSPVREDALAALVARCRDPEIAHEVNGAGSAVAACAVVEDSLHHEPWAWPEGARPDDLRPATRPERIRITLPLSSPYVSAVPSDAPWTRPVGRAS